MYPSQDRNQFPSLTPYSSRVGAGNPYASDEVSYLRESIEEGMERTGVLYAHFRRYTADWNIGECPRCYDYGSRGAGRPECPICFGTGWDGGYARPAVQRMLVIDTTEEIRVSPSGALRLNIGQSFSPGIPRISPQDLLARVYRADLEWRTGDRYVVQDNVEQIRSRDEIAELSTGTEDHLDYEPEVVGYQFRSSKIPKGIGDFIKVEYKVPFADPVWLARNPM